MAETKADVMLIERRGSVYVIEFTVTAMVDQVQIAQVGADLEQLAANAGHPKLVINMSNLNNVSSAFLGVLISLHKRVKSMSGEVRLASVPANVLNVFKLTHLDKLLKMYDNTTIALHRF